MKVRDKDWGSSRKRGSNMPGDEREQLRPRLKPGRVRLLFIGESLPKEKTTFFYYANGSLFKNTIRAFEQTFGKSWEVGSSFLVDFRKSGCYLVDLCSEPVDDLRYKSAARRNLHRAGVYSLEKKIREDNPQAVVVVGRDIQRPVANALQRAKRSLISTWFLPFPGGSQWNKDKYVLGLQAVIKELLDMGIMPDGT